MDNLSREHARGLLDDLSGGAVDVFWTLWKIHEPHLAAICRSRMAFARADAEDAISRAMLLARLKLPSYAADIIDLEAWLTRLVCNVCSDMQKERRRALRRATALDDHALMRREPTLPAPLSPEQSCISSHTLLMIGEAIAALPSRLRVAAELRLVHGAAYPAIAARLRITEPNARKRVQQARETLRERLAHFRQASGN